MDDSQTISNLFVAFLRSHDLISVTALEAKLGMPKSTLRQALKKNSPRNIPAKYFYDLGLILRDYGFDWPEIIDEDAALS